MFDKITSSIDNVSKEIISGIGADLMSKDIQDNLNSIFKHMQNGSENLLQGFPNAADLLDGLNESKPGASEPIKGAPSERSGGFLNNALRKVLHDVPLGESESMKPLQNLNETLGNIVERNNQTIDNLVRNLGI